MKFGKASESQFLPFLGKTLTSKVHRKIFIRPIPTFWVCKTYHLANGTQRTLNQDHTTSETFFIEAKVALEQIFENSVSETLPSFRIFSCFVRFLAKTLTSEARRKFFIRRTHMFWVCKTFVWVRGMQRTLNQDHTTNETFFIEGNVTLE